MAALPITQALGGAERGFRALLDRELHQAALTFPQWIALVFVDATAGALTTEGLTEHLAAGSIAPPSSAQSILDGLVARGLLTRAEGAVHFTADGQREYRALRARVDRLVTNLQRGIPEADLATTRVVLAELGRRAAHELARPGDSDAA